MDVNTQMPLDITKKTTAQKEAEILDLIMTLVQSSKSNKKTIYRETRKDIMRLFHGSDVEYKKIIKEAVSSFRSVNDLNIGEV